jgi:hypothetical protein
LRNLDFSSWQSVLATLLGLTLVTLLGVGVRLLMMMTFQQRRERLNRQINERLRTLIAAYKTLGGSFTGDLTVDPSHKRDLQRRTPSEPMAALDLSAETTAQSDRTRRIRDAVEAALSDIILLGTEDQVRLAERAVRELVAGIPSTRTICWCRCAPSSARRSTSTRSQPICNCRCRDRAARRVRAAAAKARVARKKAAEVAVVEPAWVEQAVAVWG